MCRWRQKISLFCFQRFPLTCIPISLLLLLLNGCVSASTPASPPAPTPIVHLANQSTELVFRETVDIPIENCNGNSPVVRTSTREYSTTATISLTISGEVSGGVKDVIEAKIASTLGIEVGKTQSASETVEVSVNPATQLTYQIDWYETWLIGEATIDSLNLTIPYKVRTGVQGELRSGAPEQCPSSGASSPTVPTITNTSTQTVASTPVSQSPESTTITPQQPTTTISRDLVEELAVNGETSVEQVHKCLNQAHGDARPFVGFKSGDTIPDGALIATDFGGGGRRWSEFPITPICYSGSWGLFESTGTYQAPYEGAYWIIISLTE